jgi:endonuclease/exonuclease/phosphatase family metal-dependent hydrolase
MRIGLAVLAFLSWVGSAAATPQESRALQVVAFNVLAPPWASPVWYPAALDPALLQREFRRDRIQEFLVSVRDATDVFCLQEVTDVEFREFLRALGPGFEGFMAHNDPDFWSNWIVPDIPWEPNGTAVVVRRSRFSAREFEDLAISGDGNHAAAFRGTDRESGRGVRAFSVHLDSDRESNRSRELDSLLEQSPDRGGVDVICGDINEDTVTGGLGVRLETAGFVDVLAAVGNREPTHPFSESYNRSARWAILDHVLVRNGTPATGRVFDFGVWAIADEVKRIEENLRRSGSDHFPVAGTIHP